MNKLSALFNLFRKGSVVADPAKWKNRHITVVAVTAVLLALSKALEAFGYGHFFPLTEEQAAGLAAAILIVADLVWVPTTTEKVGLPANSDVPSVPVAGSTHQDQPDSRA